MTEVSIWPKNGGIRTDLSWTPVSRSLQPC